MAPRRGPQISPPNPQSSLSPNSQQPPPRSASPSLGFTQFLTKPAKWFSRTASASKTLPGMSSEPRASLSSGGRKHKISQPTDPRPILENYMAPGARHVSFSFELRFLLPEERTRSFCVFSSNFVCFHNLSTHLLRMIRTHRMIVGGEIVFLLVFCFLVLIFWTKQSC